MASQCDNVLRYVGLICQLLTAYLQKFQTKIYLIQLAKHKVGGGSLLMLKVFRSERVKTKFLLMKPMEEPDSSSLQPIEICSPSYLRSQWAGSRTNSLSYLSA